MIASAIRYLIFSEQFSNENPTRELLALIMTSKTLDWRSKEGLAVGKGATVQEFVATIGDKSLQIDVAPWGEGHLKINGREIAHITDAKNRRQAFRNLAMAAERFLRGDAIESQSKKIATSIPDSQAKRE